jgi:phosphoglycolate phosphatase
MAVLVFDFDGVIVDSFAVARKVVNDVIVPHLQPLNKKEFAALYEQNFYEGIVAKGWPKEKMQYLMDETLQGLAHETPNVNMFSGMLDVLNELVKQHTLIIVTSNFTDVVAEYCRRHDIPITDIRGADVSPSKTKKLISIEKTFPYDDIYYIGDTAGDVHEAKKGGAVAVGTTWGFHTKEQIAKAKPYYTANSPKEVLAIFATI